MSNIPVGAYTFSDSYLRRLKKDELIEHYRTLERNWFNEIESSNIQIKNSKRLLKEEYNKAIDDFVEHITLPVTTEEQISEIVEQLKFTKGVENMNELIKRQDAINAVMQNYCYESDRLTALQSIPVTTEEKIRNEAIINYSVAVLAEVAESARQEDAPIYLGDEEVDQWVRLSDVQTAINKYLN